MTGSDPALPPPDPASDRPAGAALDGPSPAPLLRVAVLADDLIWGTRLVDLVARAGAEPVSVRSAGGFEAVLGSVQACVVDLTARSYDGLACLRAARDAGVAAVAVGQHDDAPLRRSALEAGAGHVYPYRALAAHGDRDLRRWLDELRPGGGTGMHTSIPVARYAERLAAARLATASAGLDALLVGVGADLRYLAGYAAMPLERLTLLVIPASAAAPITLVCPRLEAAPARSCPAAASGVVELATWEETEDPMALVERLLAETAGAGASAVVRDVAVSDGLRAAFVLGLQRVLPSARFSLASAVLRSLRMRKDDDETALLQAAAQAADRVVTAIAAGRLVGRTEADVAREVRDRLLAEGHEHAAFSIVASGPNSASPHHEAGERVIGAGEPIVIDIGGELGGYGSDITRTVWVTGGDPSRGPDPEFRRLYDVLQTAQAEATAAVRPGIAAERIDAVARDLIAGAGFGPLFIHRTGHGIGLEGHEDPYLVAGNAELLEAGMAFSVEPGIYLEGRFGARIEDIVVCGEDGPLVLNECPRELLVVAG